MENCYSVYKHTFPNGKVYIGITRQDPKLRWRSGKGYLSINKDGSYNQPLIANAVMKYDWNEIKHEILFAGLTKQEAEQTEVNLILYYKANDRNFGYNIENGGNLNGKHTEETKRKISQSNKGRKVSEDAKKKMSASHKGKKMPPVSLETREKLSKANKGKQCPDEVRKKISQAKKGKASHTKPVICLDTGIIYQSAVEAEKATGALRAKICEVCKDRRNKAGGFRWAYYKIPDEDVQNNPAA